MVGVFVRVDHSLGHILPDLAEQFDHLASMSQVRLCVDDYAAAQIDES